MVNPGSIQAVPIATETEIRPLIEAYDKSLQDLQDPLVSPNDSARKLYEALVKPALPFLSGSSRLIVIPDGILYSLNFETLPVQSPKPHYWVEDVTITVAPSLGLLNSRATSSPVAARSMLLIGDPESPDPEFPRLADAAEEMSEVQKSLPGARMVVLKGKHARPSAWIEAHPGTFDLIHFTAHATANREQPLESAVILSRDDSGGFKLHARDVIETRLQASLVTISACRSAGARIYSGEGLVGLAWAFLRTGARNVIAGLWDVDDKSGAGIMGKLYAGMAGGHGAAEALRAAKLAMIHAPGVHRKPYYWGAFQLFTTDAVN